MARFNFKKYKGIPKISSVIVLISFFMPFCVVKCNNMKVDNLTGINLCTGTSFNTSTQNEDDSFLAADEEASLTSNEEAATDDTDYMPPKVFALISLLLGIFAAVFAFMGDGVKRVQQGMIANLAGMIALIGLYVEMRTSEGNYEKGYIIIELSMGFFLAFLGFMIGFLFYFFLKRRENKAEANMNTVDDLIIQD